MKIFGMITTRGSLDYTRLALRSFFDHTEPNDEFEFHLIDNDGSYELNRAERDREIHLVRNTSPRGFAENVNSFIDTARAKKADLFCLNNDLVFAPGWIAPLLGSGNSIISPLSNREYQYNTDFFSTHVAMSLHDYTGHEEDFRKLAFIHAQRNRGYLDVLSLPFFCVKIPYETLDRLGHLDTCFGAGGAEDYDYCLRATLAGIPIRYALESYVLHFGGKSSWSGPESKDQQRAREAHFMKAFREKWGDALFDLVLKDLAAPFADNPELQRDMEQKNFRSIILKLKPALLPLIKM